MSFSFEADEDLEAIVEAVRGFAAEQIRPQLRELEEARGLTAELAEALVELGLTTLPLPEVLGGSDDLDARAEALCLEEIAYGDVGVAAAIPGPGSAAVAILAAGSEAQQQSLLTPFAEPSDPLLCGTLAWAEGPCGVEPGAIEATCKRDGDVWVLAGSKRYVLGGGRAQLLLVLARDTSSQAADPWDRLKLLAAEGPLPAEEPDRTMGIWTADYATVKLDGARVPAARVLDTAQPGTLREVVERTLAHVKLTQAAALVGCARAACAYAFNYATERQAFGQYLYEFQALAFMMADMATRTDGLRTLVWEAAWAFDQGEGALAAALRAHQQAAELSVSITSDAVQILGGHGYLWDHPVEKWMRDARTLSLVDGLTVPLDRATSLTLSL